MNNFPTSVVRVLVRPIGGTGAGAAYSAVLLVLRWLRLLRPELLDHGDEGGVRVVVGGRDQAADAGV